MQVNYLTFKESLDFIGIHYNERFKMIGFFEKGLRPYTNTGVRVITKDDIPTDALKEYCNKERIRNKSTLETFGMAVFRVRAAFGIGAARELNEDNFCENEAIVKYCKDNNIVYIHFNVNMGERERGEFLQKIENYMFRLDDLMPFKDSATLREGVEGVLGEPPAVQGAPTEGRARSKDEQREMARRMRDNGEIYLDIAKKLYPNAHASWMNDNTSRKNTLRNNLEKRVSRLLE